MKKKHLVPGTAGIVVSLDFYDEIRSIVQSARSQIYTAVNTAMVESYWLIGKRIVEEEQHGKERAQYGQALLQTLSAQLTSEFGKGFSVANLKNFRQFYLTFPDNKKGYALRSELSWTHYRTLIRIKDTKARLQKRSCALNWNGNVGY